MSEFFIKMFINLGLVLLMVLAAGTFIYLEKLVNRSDLVADAMLFGNTEDSQAFVTSSKGFYLERILNYVAVVFHESLHAIIGLLFGYHISVAFIKFDKSNPETLGETNYETRQGGICITLWQSLGRTLMGIAPIIGITYLTYLMVSSLISGFGVFLNFADFNIVSSYNLFFQRIVSSVLFYWGSITRYPSALLLIFLISAILGKGLDLSSADIDTALSGLGYFIFLCTAIFMLLGNFSYELSGKIIILVFAVGTPLLLFQLLISVLKKSLANHNGKH